MIGIYKITSPTKKIYIGQSSNIEKRFNLYFKLRCKGQIKLYNSLKKYGVNKHKFEILCECEILELNDKERYYQDLFSVTKKNGLNLKLTKSNDRKCSISEETKLKISIGNKIVNAKKRGDFEEDKDYSLVKNKKPRKKNIYFEKTNETFKSIKDLYDAHPYFFRSYNSLCYNLKRNYNLITFNVKPNEKNKSNNNNIASAGGLE